MKLNFNIDYRTAWGESIYLTGDIPALGSGDESKAVKMNLDRPGFWTLVLELPDGAGAFNYNYIVRNEHDTLRHEWGGARRFSPGHDVASYEIYDSWQDQPADQAILFRCIH